MSDILFFGCWDKPGHYLYGPGRGYVAARRADLPCRLEMLDSTFAPKGAGYQPLGVATVTHLNGWTLVAWWDRTGDERFGSNSVLLMKGTHPLMHVLLEAADKFPGLMPRFAALVEVKP